jgi:hypothetical protein
MWYTIQSTDDWLSRLAIKFLGDVQLWPEIYSVNKDIIGPNPDIVTVGQKIWIPVDGAPRPSNAVAAPEYTSDNTPPVVTNQAAPGNGFFANFTKDPNKLLMAGAGGIGLVVVLSLLRKG